VFEGRAAEHHTRTCFAGISIRSTAVPSGAYRTTQPPSYRADQSESVGIVPQTTRRSGSAMASWNHDSFSRERTVDAVRSPSLRGPAARDP
jgi:hypothetical protein